MMAWGLPGCSRSSSVRDQQASWTMSRRAMQMRKDASLPIVEVGLVCDRLLLVEVDPIKIWRDAILGLSAGVGFFWRRWMTR